MDEVYEQLVIQRPFFDAQGFCEELLGMDVQCASKPPHIRVGLRREARVPNPRRRGRLRLGNNSHKVSASFVRCSAFIPKPRMRWVVEAVIALCLSLSPQGFTASELARQVRMLSNQAEGQYDARRAAYDLKKLRGKKIVHRIDQTRRYQSTSSGLKAMVALVVLRNKAIKPLLAAAQDLHPSRGAQNPRPLDRNYETIRMAMQSVFQELGLAA